MVPFNFGTIIAYHEAAEAMITGRARVTAQGGSGCGQRSV